MISSLNTHASFLLKNCKLLGSPYTSCRKVEEIRGWVLRPEFHGRFLQVRRHVRLDQFKKKLRQCESKFVQAKIHDQCKCHPAHLFGWQPGYKENYSIGDFDWFRPLTRLDLEVFKKRKPWIIWKDCRFIDMYGCVNKDRVPRLGIHLELPS